MRTARLLGPLLTACALACASTSLVACGGGERDRGEHQGRPTCPPARHGRASTSTPCTATSTWSRTRTTSSASGSAPTRARGASSPASRRGTCCTSTGRSTSTGSSGRPRSRSGKGYFIYKMGGEKIAELDGQFGIGQRRDGGRLAQREAGSHEPRSQLDQGRQHGGSAGVEGFVAVGTTFPPQPHPAGPPPRRQRGGNVS